MRGDSHQVETTTTFSPKFDDNGLIPAIVQDAGSDEVIMFAFMNQLALEKTITTGTAHYWSRSRNKLWLKGETSGETQQIVEIRTDCDQDVILIRVNVQGRGASCHTGKRACFYRQVETTPAKDGKVKLVDTGGERLFDPAKVYK
ncbi:MAG TPA: phosphoribosyl-AMP cyclohydrolase [Rhizobiales bacterium]|nr:phosphoribosyl-AMP cyclohydrolase [Hyphomicrobiales bacterium]